MAKRITKKLLAARSKFRQRVTNFIRALGGVEANGVYGFKLRTPIGELGISVWDAAIMCRFDDVERASKETCCNPFSGKWNWHYADDAATLDGRPESDFVRSIAKIMLVRA
jgi:hypothetical protein